MIDPTAQAAIEALVTERDDATDENRDDAMGELFAAIDALREATK